MFIFIFFLLQLTAVPLVRIVPTVIVMVTNPRSWNALLVVTAILALRARSGFCEHIHKNCELQRQIYVKVTYMHRRKWMTNALLTTVSLIRSISTVIVPITAPANGHTAVVITAEISQRVTGQFICMK